MSLPAAFQKAGIPVDVEQMTKALGAVAGDISNDVGGAFDGRDLLKLSQDDGEWVYGLDEIEIEKDERVAIDPTTLKHGYVSWKDSKIAGEEMVSIFDAIPNQDDLPDTGEDWTKQYRFDAVLLPNHEELIFKSNTVGSARAFKSILTSLKAALSDHPEYYVPVVTLSSTSYVNKKHGNKTVYNPVIKVVDWADVNGDLMSQTDAPETAPKAKTTAPETAPEKEVVNERPTRRTRAKR